MGNYGDLIAIENRWSKYFIPYVQKQTGFQMEFRGFANPYSIVHRNLHLLLDLLICCCAFSFQPEFLFTLTIFLQN